MTCLSQGHQLHSLSHYPAPSVLPGSHPPVLSSVASGDAMENRGCVNPGDSPTIHSWMSRKWVGTSEESQLDKWKNFPGSASSFGGEGETKL